MPKVEEYLGDGVYATFTGMGIWLDLRAQDSTTRIFLEPQVFNALVLFKNRVTAPPDPEPDAADYERDEETQRDEDDLEARAIDAAYEQARDAGTLPEYDEHGVRIELE